MVAASDATESTTVEAEILLPLFQIQIVNMTERYTRKASQYVDKLLSCTLFTNEWKVGGGGMKGFLNDVLWNVIE